MFDRLVNMSTDEKLALITMAYLAYLAWQVLLELVREIRLMRMLARAPSGLVPPGTKPEVPGGTTLD